MDIKQAEYLITIEEKRNISKAAEVLFITQPALSKFLRQQEDYYGIQIFDREHGLVPTYEGRILLDYVHRCVYDYKQTVDILSDLKDGESGNIYVGIPNIRLNSLFADFLCAFIIKYPKIHVSLSSGPIESIVNDIETGAIDIGCMMPETARTNLEYTSLYTENLYIAAPKSLVKDIVQPDGSISLFSLNGMPYVGLTQEYVLRKTTDALLNQHNVEVLPFFETDNMQLIYQMINHGLGFTISTLPQLGVTQDMQSNVCFFQISEKKMSWNLGVVYRSQKYIGNKYHIFIKELQEYLHLSDYHINKSY